MSTVTFDTLAFSKRLHLLAEMATKKDLAELEARLAWRLITAGIAIAGIAVAAVVALLRFVG